MVITADAAAPCLIREAVEAGRVRCSYLPSCFAGRKLVVLEDEFYFATGFSVSSRSHLWMSFSPQLQNIWAPVFSRPSLCCKAGHSEIGLCPLWWPVHVRAVRAQRPGLTCTDATALWFLLSPPLCVYGQQRRRRPSAGGADAPCRAQPHSSGRGAGRRVQGSRASDGLWPFLATWSVTYWIFYSVHIVRSTLSRILSLLALY